MRRCEMRLPRLVRRKALPLVVLGVCCATLTILIDLTNTILSPDVHKTQSGPRSLAKNSFQPNRAQLTDSLVAQRFEERRLRVQRACGRLKLTPYRGMRHVSKRLIFPTTTSPPALYCPVPKTGTTYLKKAFAVHNNNSRNVWVERFNVRPIDDYDEAVMFFFTRDPYTRIVSAYLDKLWSPNLHFWRALGKEILPLVRPNASLTSLGCGHDVKFTEFIRYFIDGMTNGDRINTHLVPTHKFCEPCNYTYDYIGKLETFREDAAFILSAINVSVKAAQNYSNDNDILSEHIAQAYYAMYWDSQHCLSKHSVLLRTWRALQFRGLVSIAIPFPWSESATTNLTKEAFRVHVQHIAEHSKKQFAALDEQSLRQAAESDSESRASQSSLSLTARDRQKRSMMASAYAFVPMEDRRRVMALLREEFELFGYNSEPSDVFAPSYPLNPNIFDLTDV